MLVGLASAGEFVHQISKIIRRIVIVSHCEVVFVNSNIQGICRINNPFYSIPNKLHIFPNFVSMPRKRKNPIPAIVIEFGKKIKQLRLERKMSQMDVGASMGIDRENIRKYEKGIQEPKLSTVVKFAEVFAVTFDELLNSEEK